jgi:hypothetical protein
MEQQRHIVSTPAPDPWSERHHVGLIFLHPNSSPASTSSAPSRTPSTPLGDRDPAGRRSLFHNYMRYRNFVRGIATFIKDMSPAGLLRRLRVASELKQLLAADANGGGDISFLSLITAFTQSVEPVWDRIQEQRRIGDTPPTRTDRAWCRMYIATFYKANLLRGVPRKLQTDFEAFLRSVESVFFADDDDDTQPADASSPSHPMSSASRTTDLPRFTSPLYIPKET